MSLIKTTDIQCDSCMKWVHGWTSSLDRKLIVSRLRKEGWILTDGKHYCPQCSKQTALNAGDK